MPSKAKGNAKSRRGPNMGHGSAIGGSAHLAKQLTAPSQRMTCPPTGKHYRAKQRGR